MITKNKLYYYRKYKKELTQSEVAKKTGIPVPSYSHKERGISEFSLSEAISVAKAFDITVERLHELLTTYVEVDLNEV